MENNNRFKSPVTIQKIAINFYLCLVALYFCLASAHLINILINLTVESNVGLYFEFINASADRNIVYFLNFLTMVYITTKSRKISLVLLYTMYMFASYFVFTQITDLLIILTSFIILAWFLTIPQPFSTMSRKKAVSLAAVYLILILVIVEFSALTCWFIFPFLPTLSQEGTCKYLVDLETKMFLLTGCLAPIFTILFLFSWIAKLPFPYVSLILKRLRIILFNQRRNSLDNTYYKKLLSLLFLTCPITLSLLVTVYPYMLGLNVDTRPIGVDAPFYEESLTKSASDDFLSVLANFFFTHPDRPLSLLILHVAKCVSGLSALTVVQFSPVVLGPVLVLAVYFFMKEVNSQSCMPLLASFLSVSSFHILVGLYGFFLSNWMALIELYLFMGLFFGSVRRKSHLRMIAAILLSVSLLFTHSWTWGMAIGVLFTYLIIMIIFKRERLGESRFESRYLLIVILVNVLAGVTRNYVLGRVVGDFETVNFAQETVSMGALVFLWEDLMYTFLHTMYGFFVNPLALFLAVLGAFITVLDDKPVNRYLTSWLLASCIFFVLGSGWVIKSRILFNLPLPIFEAVGLASIGSVVQKVFESGRTLTIKILVILLVLLVNLNYAFRCAFMLSQI